MEDKSIIDHIVIYTRSKAIVYVAKKGQVQDWAAYVDAFDSGMIYSVADENLYVGIVARTGTKLSREHAEGVFPCISLKYRS